MRGLLTALAVLLISPPFALAQTTSESLPEPGDEPPQIAPSALTIDISAPPAPVQPGARNAPLRGIDLKLGHDIRLGLPFVSDEQAPQGCIEKPALGAVFCVDPMIWPQSLATAIKASPAVFAGDRAIIRYDEGLATQAHVLFPTEAFVDVTEHLAARYGPPTEQDIHWVPMFGQPKLANVVARWISESSTDKPASVIEVRTYDDIRHPHPDQKHGFVWLYRDGSTPIFRTLAMADIMLLRKKGLTLVPLDTPPPE